MSDGSAMPAAEDWFHTIATHYLEAQIYFHLNQVDAFRYLSRELGAEVREIAEERGLDGRILRILLDYVANVGEIVECTGGDRYRMSDFGKRVLGRYGKTNGDRQIYNMFDVRVGAWGPLWYNLKSLLDGTMIYGRDIRRVGDFAADGLFKLAHPLANAVERQAARLQAAVVVEIGPTSGILAQLAERNRSRRYIGVDVKRESLEQAAALAAERAIRGIEWQLGDLFAPDAWLRTIDSRRPVLFFSCHFHEFLAGGKEPVRSAIEKIISGYPQAAVSILEQPRLQPSERDRVLEREWLYNHSNVLIHHLIRNAQILSASEWRQLLLDAGCREVSVEATDCFGFRAFVGSTPLPTTANLSHPRPAP